MSGRAALRLLVLMLVIVAAAVAAASANLRWPWIVLVMFVVWAIVAWIDWSASRRASQPDLEPAPELRQPPRWARLLGARPRPEPAAFAEPTAAAQHVRVLAPEPRAEAEEPVPPGEPEEIPAPAAVEE